MGPAAARTSGASLPPDIRLSASKGSLLSNQYRFDDAEETISLDFSDPWYLYKYDAGYSPLMMSWFPTQGLGDFPYVQSSPVRDWQPSDLASVLENEFQRLYVFRVWHK
jgi:hypothetical protein